MRGLYYKRNTQQRGIFWALENTDRGARTLRLAPGAVRAVERVDGQGQKLRVRAIFRVSDWISRSISGLRFWI
jgi:hypothetical protein